MNMKKNQNEMEQSRAAQSTNDENFGRMIEPDILVSGEYARVYGKRVFEPEEQLMVSVLEKGVADFRRMIFARDKKGARRFAEAESWILSDDSDWVFSFSNCCAVLGIEPGYLRKGLLAWRQAQLTRAAFTPQPKKNIFREAA